MPFSARPIDIKALSGARALPPLILVLYHFCEGHGYRDARLFDLLVGKGYLWVEFFFALSGFILIHVYGRKIDDVLHGKAYVPFLQARLSRLYPLHLFTLLSMLALMLATEWLANEFGFVSIYHQPWPPMNPAEGFVANLFMVQAWNLFPWLTWNGASWFVSVEFLLCLLFPLYLALSRGGVWRGVGLIAAGVGTLAILAFSTKYGFAFSLEGYPHLYWPTAHGVGLDLTYQNGIYRGMAGFGVGVGLAVLYRHAADAAGRLPTWAFTAAQIGALAYFAWAIYGTGWAHTPNDIFTAVAMFALIFVIAFDRGFLARFFAAAPLRKLGEWSYGIYLGQTFWLQSIRTIEQQIYPPSDTLILGIRFADLMWWAEPFLLMGVCILWGAALTKLIEQPANAALRTWLARRKTETA
jgi:peptidoglycan/LPS O-acetylase OafA/YrhL